MNALSNSEQLKSFIVPKVAYIITFFDNIVKLTVCKGGNINGLYFYIEIILSPTTLNNSVQRSRHFVTSSSTNNDTKTL